VQQVVAALRRRVKKYLARRNGAKIHYISVSK
jgi:hypothetical protein